MIRIITILLLLAVVIQRTYSQQVGNCEPGNAEAYIDVAEVRARILNTGGLFWDGDPHVYEVPKDSGNMSIFNASVWIGGYTDDTLRMAATMYGHWEFWPGPLDESGNPPSDCSEYDRLYTVYRSDIVAYERTGESDNPDFLEWPVELGAPVVDGDGIVGNYNLEGGDRPAILGDQMVWWVMNDLGNTHRITRADPVGIEVRVSAFASSGSPYATFYKYEIVYKGQRPLRDAYFGIWADLELGKAGGDFAGSDSLLHMGYVYSANDFDGSYKDRPPALGFLFLDPEDIGGPGTRMNSFMKYVSGTISEREEPGSGIHYYNNLTCRTKFGNPLTEWEYGFFGKEPTCFHYPGDPVTREGWSEENPCSDGQCPPHWGSVPLVAMSSGPFHLAPGDTATVHFGILWAQGRNRLDSVTLLKEYARSARGLYPLVLAGPPYPWDRNRLEPLIPYEIDRDTRARIISGGVFPNPTSESVSLRFYMPEASQVSIKVIDVLGREVLSLPEQPFEEGYQTVSMNVQHLPPGVYFAQVTNFRGSNVSTFVVSR